MNTTELHESYNQAYRTRQLETWCSHNVIRMFDHIREREEMAAEFDRLLDLIDEIEKLSLDTHMPESALESINRLIENHRRTALRSDNQ